MDRMDPIEILTFDCYGTLIDWETGLLDALRPIFDHHALHPDEERVLELYARLEAGIEAGPYRLYREVLSGVLTAIGQELGFQPTGEEVADFAGSVTRWPPFPDSSAALLRLGRRYRLGVISNVDDDLFAASARLLGIRFEWVITAEQVRAYKPDRRNFQAAFERIGRPRDRILHVAQSLYHDIAPASALGLTTAWINRRHGRTGSGATPPASARSDLVFTDLLGLAEALVPED